jgi:glycogen operon protein
VVGFKLSDCTDGKEWRLLIDTNIPDDETGNFGIGDHYGVTARSLLLFELQTGAGP